MHVRQKNHLLLVLPDDYVTVSVVLSLPHLMNSVDANDHQKQNRKQTECPLSTQGAHNICTVARTCDDVPVHSRDNAQRSSRVAVERCEPERTFRRAAEPSGRTAISGPSGTALSPARKKFLREMP